MSLDQPAEVFVRHPKLARDDLGSQMRVRIPRSDDVQRGSHARVLDAGARVSVTGTTNEDDLEGRLTNTFERFDARSTPRDIEVVDTKDVCHALQRRSVIVDEKNVSHLVPSAIRVAT